MMAATVWAADASAQSFSVTITLSGGSQQAAATRDDGRRGTFTLRRTAGGGFPAGNYGCTSQVTGNGVCNNYTYMTLVNPNGTPIGSDSDSPYCQVSNLAVNVNLDSSAPSGTYTCYVGASGNEYETGDPASGYWQNSKYWGDSQAMTALVVRGLQRLLTPFQGIE
jgi:hypothetical protein